MNSNLRAFVETPVPLWQRIALALLYAAKIAFAVFALGYWLSSPVEAHERPHTPRYTAGQFRPEPKPQVVVVQQPKQAAVVVITVECCYMTKAEAAERERKYRQDRRYWEKELGIPIP